MNIFRSTWTYVNETQKLWRDIWFFFKIKVNRYIEFYNIRCLLFYAIFEIYTSTWIYYKGDLNIISVWVRKLTQFFFEKCKKLRFLKFEKNLKYLSKNSKFSESFDFSFIREIQTRALVWNQSHCSVARLKFKLFTTILCERLNNNFDDKIKLLIKKTSRI